MKHKQVPFVHKGITMSVTWHASSWWSNENLHQLFPAFPTI